MPCFSICIRMLMLHKFLSLYFQRTCSHVFFFPFSFLQLKEKKVKPKISNEETTNKSNPFSEEDSDVEAIAKLYEEKYVSAKYWNLICINFL